MIRVVTSLPRSVGCLPQEKDIKGRGYFFIRSEVFIGFKFRVIKLEDHLQVIKIYSVGGHRLTGGTSTFSLMPVSY